MLINTTPPQTAVVTYFSRVIDAHVESVAKSKGYNNAASCASYVTDPNPAWAAEASAFVAWRSQVWTTALNLLNSATAIPTEESVIAALPAMVWPT